MQYKESFIRKYSEFLGALLSFFFIVAITICYFFYQIPLWLFVEVILASIVAILIPVLYRKRLIRKWTEQGHNIDLVRHVLELDYVFFKIK